MGKFADLVQDYSSHLANRIILTSRYGDQIPYREAVLRSKIDKHLRTKNLRSIAHYLALYHRDYGTMPDSFLTDFGGQLRKVDIRSKVDRGIHSFGYPHTDGTHHWFDGGFRQ